MDFVSLRIGSCEAKRKSISLRMRLSEAKQKFYFASHEPKRSETDHFASHEPKRSETVIISLRMIPSEAKQIISLRMNPSEAKQIFSLRMNPSEAKQLLHAKKFTWPILILFFISWVSPIPELGFWKFWMKTPLVYMVNWTLEHKNKPKSTNFTKIKPKTNY